MQGNNWILREIEKCIKIRVNKGDTRLPKDTTAWDVMLPRAATSDLTNQVRGRASWAPRRYGLCPLVLYLSWAGKMWRLVKIIFSYVLISRGRLLGRWMIFGRTHTHMSAEVHQMRLYKKCDWFMQFSTVFSLRFSGFDAIIHTAAVTVLCSTKGGIHFTRIEPAWWN